MSRSTAPINRRSIVISIIDCMDKNRRCGFVQSNMNAGFSIVELIICVSILAIAAVPLIKSMGLTTKVNSKAQSVQNANSLGEKIMEEIKSTSIADLHTKHGGGFNAAGQYIINLGSQQATQGETFDVVVTIDMNKYKDGDDDFESTTDNVKAANKTRLPEIEEIDTLSQAVLSSTKEFNKYDKEALNFFNQKLANYPTDTATITSKTIDIVKTDVTYPTGVRVKVSVTYEDDATNEEGDPAPNKYVRELYTGTFVPVNKEGSSTEYKPLDSNIYIFYSKNEDTTVIPSTLQEVINITDSADYTNPVDASSMDSHRVYFIRQKIADTTGPKLIFNGETFTYSNIDTLTEGEKIVGSGKIDFISNLGTTVSSTDGHIYKTKSKIRVYDITIELKKGSDVVSTLNSTVRANDNESALPTATPAPEGP